MSDLSTALALGIDLGGTKVEVALVDAEGRLVASRRQPTGADRGLESVVADIVSCAKHCLSNASNGAIAAGVGVAGQVDARRGIVRFAPNLRWKDVPLQAMLERALGLPVVIENDVRAATWAECLYGAGAGARDLVALFLGTGVGGGVVSGGQMLEGHGYAAGELGHMTIVAGGRKCRCPNRGCLEAYVGGWAIAERAQEAVLCDLTSGQTMLALAGAPQNITAATVSQSYHEGDLLACLIMEETAQYLADGTVSIVNAFNPQFLILGGGIVEGVPGLVSPVEREVVRRALAPATEGLRVMKTALGTMAGVIGAASLARTSYGHQSASRTAGRTLPAGRMKP